MRLENQILIRESLIKKHFRRKRIHRCSCASCGSVDVNVLTHVIVVRANK